MSVELTSYINFNGDAAAALKFYQSIFGGEADAQTFGEFNETTGNAMEVPPIDNDKVMHGTLMSEHVNLMISDYPSTWENTPTDSNIVLSLSGDDGTTLRKYWAALAENGTVTQPLELAPWGDSFGSLTDRFGVSWMVNISGN